MSAAPPPLDREPRSVRPRSTSGTIGEHLHGREPEAWRRAIHLDRVAALLEPLDGIELSECEHAVLGWISGWDIHTIAPLVRVLHAARAADPLDQPTAGGAR